MSDEIRQYGLEENDSYELEEIKARIEKRNEEKAARKKKARNKVIAFFVILFVLIGLFIFSLTDFFVVDYIAVEGNTHFEQEEIINIAHATPGKNLIYHPGKGEIISYLEANPYIKNAEVKRRLPSTLVIKVEEREEMCALKYDDDYLVIDSSGMLLKKTNTKPLQTLIKGLVVTKIALGEVIEVEDEELKGKTLDIISAMNENDLYFVTIDVSGTYIKCYVFDGLVVKGSYDQMISSIKNGNLHKVIERLLSENIKRGTITLSEEGSISFEPVME